MIHKIWLNILRCYYSSKGLDYKGKTWAIGYKKGTYFTISNVKYMTELNGFYKAI